MHDTRDDRWAVIFDVDGTMVDNAAYHELAWLTFGQRQGLPITSDFYRAHIHARNNAAIARTLFGPDVDYAYGQEMAEEKERIYREIYAPHIKPNPGLMGFLAGLGESGVPCAAASNSPPENVDLVFGALGVVSQFEHVLTQDGVNPGKPDPGMLLDIAKRLELSPARCLVIEDSPSGFLAAENAGMPYVVITCGAHGDGLQHAAKAKGRFRDFHELTIEQARAALEG